MTEGPLLLYPGPRNALLRRIAALTTDELHALDAAVRELAAAKSHRHVDKGIHFAWWSGPRLPKELERELDDLFPAVLAALAEGLTGVDVQRVSRLTPQKTGLEALTAMFLRPRPPNPVQEISVHLIEEHVAPWDPRLAIIATWNVACAAALRGRLPDAAIETLEAAWRRAIGDPPA